MHTCIYIYIYIYIYTRTHIRIYICIYVYRFPLTHTQIYINIYIYIYRRIAYKYTDIQKKLFTYAEIDDGSGVGYLTKVISAVLRSTKHVDDNIYIYIYIYIYTLSAWAEEYTDCISAKGLILSSSKTVLDTTLTYNETNHLGLKRILSTPSLVLFSGTF